MICNNYCENSSGWVDLSVHGYNCYQVPVSKNIQKWEIERLSFEVGVGVSFNQFPLGTFSQAIVSKRENFSYSGMILRIEPPPCGKLRHSNWLIALAIEFFSNASLECSS